MADTLRQTIQSIAAEAESLMKFYRSDEVEKGVLLRLIWELAEAMVKLTPAETLPLEDLEEGKTYELTLRVKATITEISRGQYRCCDLQLETRDYFGGRTVSVDEDEIVSAEEVSP